MLSPHMKAQGRHSWLLSEAPHYRIQKGCERLVRNNFWTVGGFLLLQLGTLLKRQVGDSGSPQSEDFLSWPMALWGSACFHPLLLASPAAQPIVPQLLPPRKKSQMLTAVRVKTKTPRGGWRVGARELRKDAPFGPLVQSQGDE